MSATRRKVLAAACRSVAAFWAREARLALTAASFLTLLVLALARLGMLGSGAP
jgi:hypothetical protein